MNQDFKIKLLNYLKTYGEIEFENEFHHKGSVFSSSIPKEKKLSEEIDNWINYDEPGIKDFLVDNGIFYDYNGKFLLEQDEVILHLTFRGPYDGEKDDVFISLDEYNLPNPIKNRILKTVKEINKDDFILNFLYEENVFEKFEFDYYYEGNIILSDKDFNEVELVELKKIVEQEIKKESYVLDFQYMGEKFIHLKNEDVDYVECYDDSNKLYFFSSETYKIKFDDID